MVLHRAVSTGMSTARPGYDETLPVEGDRLACLLASTHTWRRAGTTRCVRAPQTFGQFALRLGPHPGSVLIGTRGASGRCSIRAPTPAAST